MLTALPQTANLDVPVGAVLADAELAFVDALDAAICTAATRAGARALQFPQVQPMRLLDRAGYSSAFPQHVTVPVHGCCGQAHNDVALLPAACLPVYDHYAGRMQAGPTTVTTRNTCWRHERRFEPLRRQWAFTMREVVCIGTVTDVRSFLARWRRTLVDLADGLGIGATLLPATDPFFGPDQARRLFQQVAEAKTELVADGLAIASLNNHGSHFARAFDLGCADLPARSACVAFGLERWLAAMRAAHGPDAATWPAIPAVALDGDLQ